MFWTVMLQYALPHRVQELVGDARKGEYLGYISVIGAVATTVIQLVVAPLSDACASKWGRRHPFILFGIAANVLATAGFALAGNFPLLLASFFGIQLFLNIANGPYQALLPDTVPPERHGVASTYMGGALLLGQLFGALSLLGALLLKVFSFEAVLVVVLALLVVGAFVTWKFVPDAPAPQKEQLSFRKAMETLLDLRVRENPDFFGLLYSRFFVNLSYSTVTSFLLYYLQDTIGLGEDGAGRFQPILILVATIAGLVGTVIAGKSLAKFTKKQVVYASSALIGLAALIFAFTGSKEMVLALGFLFGAGWGAFQAVDWALAVNLLPPGGAARYMAVWHVCMTVPQIVAPLFGRVADALNHSLGHGIGWRAAMLSTVVYLAIGTGLLTRVRERDSRENA